MNKQKRILIAEDELLIAKVLRMQLEKAGFEVDNVLDADAAFARAIQFQPDVIILDVFLKGKSSGIEAGKRIRQAGIETAIIFTTGNSYETTIQQISGIKNSNVLSKPVEFEVLLKLINGI